MGCGASKGSEPAVFPQNIKPEKQAAASIQIDGSSPLSARKSAKEQDITLVNAASLTNVAGDGNVEPSETQLASSSEIVKEKKDDTPQPPVDATALVPPITLPQDNTPNQLESADAANPARDAFRARLQNENGPSSPQIFKSTRSLSRSIGVRRRSGEGSESGVLPPLLPPIGGQLPAATEQDNDDAAEQDAWCEADEEEVKEDPLLEEFERNKEANPILRKVTGNGILSSRGTERSSKSNKRLAVGFAMDTDPSSESPPSGVDGATDVVLAAKQSSGSVDSSDSDDLKLEAAPVASSSG